MTTSRSRSARAGWKRIVARSTLYAGLALFLACWLNGWAVQSRILGHPEFSRPVAGRTYPIVMKGSTFFVEERYGRRYNAANWLILLGFAMYAGSITYLNDGLWRSSK